jgi:diguanylate cyclase (GGDEF)-like protein
LHTVRKVIRSGTPVFAFGDNGIGGTGNELEKQSARIPEGSTTGKGVSHPSYFGIIPAITEPEATRMSRTTSDGPASPAVPPPRAAGAAVPAQVIRPTATASPAAPARRRPADGFEALTGEWLKAVTAAGFVPGPRARARAALSDLLQQVAAAVRAEPFDRAPGIRVGAELVALHMSAPQVIGATVRLLAGRLPALLAGPGVITAELRDRVLDVLEQVVNGFVAAQRDAAVRAAEELNSAEKTHWRATQDDLQRRLRHALLHQHRSGLPNRAHLRQHLTESIASSDRIGLCLLSIDRFADLSDALGPDAAEDLLDAVAARLDPVARQSGYFLAHLGDEFALVVTGTNGIDDVLKAADQARTAIDTAPAPALDGYRLRLTATTGIVENATAATRPDTWLRDAHLALGWARLAGRDCTAYEPSRADADLRRHRLAAALPAALDRGEIIPWYQPLCRLDTGRIVGVEALARWQRPHQPVGAGRADLPEPIGPEQFITVAERTGLIVPLGRTILEQACRQGVAWRDLGHDVMISVNLSPFQLFDPNLPADLAAILRDLGLPATGLQLEITESAALGEGRAVLHRLAALGPRIAIDDFGTGYSSLALLPLLPVTDVKLAGEFVATSAAAPTGAVLRHTIDLCHDLGIRVTAEALETQDDVDCLRDLGCDLGQGYHFGRPVPAAALSLQPPSPELPAS